MRRFLAPSGNDESAKHAPSRSRLLCGRRKNDSVNPCVGEGVRNYGSTVFWLVAWGFGTLGGVRCSFSGVWIFGLHCLGVRNFGSTVFWLAAWGFGTLGGVRSLGVWIFGLLCLGVRNFGSTVFWLAGYLDRVQHTWISVSLCGCSLRGVWFFGFSLGRMARW